MNVFAQSLITDWSVQAMGITMAVVIIALIAYIIKLRKYLPVEESKKPAEAIVNKIITNEPQEDTIEQEIIAVIMSAIAQMENKPVGNFRLINIKKNTKWKDSII